MSLTFDSIPEQKQKVGKKGATTVMEVLAKNSTGTIVMEEEGGGTWISVVWCVVVGSFGSVVLGSVALGSVALYNVVLSSVVLGCVVLGSVVLSSVVLGSVAPPLSCCLERAPAAQEVPTSPPIMIILWKKIFMMSDQKCRVRPIKFLSEI